jgi:hypothetical protein
MHAASQTTASSKEYRILHVPIACHDAAELYKKDMQLYYKVMKKAYKNLAAVPGLKPSNLPVILSPTDFVMQLKGLQVLAPSDCSAQFIAHVEEYDAVFSKALDKTSDTAAAWQAALQHLRKDISGITNKVIDVLVQECATSISAPIVIESNLLMQVEQLQGAAIEYADQ